MKIQGSAITIYVFDPNGREITEHVSNLKGNIDTTQHKNEDGTYTKPKWPSYVLQQWSNMKLSDDKNVWGKNDSTINNRPELGQYKIVCCYTSNPEIYSVISLATRPYDLSLDEEALQLNPWDWYSNKPIREIPPPADNICHNNTQDACSDSVIVVTLEKYGSSA